MPNNIVLEIFYGGEWHDLIIDEKVFTGDPITITRGSGAESVAFRPSQLTAQLNNEDDSFRLSNPESPLYGAVGRNTPLRLSMNSELRVATEATSWVTDQTRDFRRTPKRGRAWTDLTSGGLLERINNWKEPLKSTMTRFTQRISDSLGFFPLEDGRDATALSNLLPTGLGGKYTGVDLENEEAPGGSSTTAKINSLTALMSGTFIRSTASGWQASVCIKLSTFPTGVAQDLFRVYDTTGRLWVLKISSVGYDFDAYASDGTFLQSVNTGHSVNPLAWIRFTLKVSISAGTITMRQQRFQENDSVAYGTSATFSGTTTAQPSTWQIPGNAYTNGANYAAVFAVSQATTDLIFGLPDFLGSFQGYNNETTRNRFGRIMIEELGSSSWQTVGTAATAMVMGPQKPATLAQLLREIRDTEDGMMYDAKSSTKVVFRLRSGRYNRTAISIDVTEMPDTPKEITDNLGIYNTITVENRAGDSAVAVDSTSPMSTQAPPNGVGEEQSTVNVNLYDPTTLPQHANWWLRRGTVDLPRYPQVVINLASLPLSRRVVIAAIDVGDVIEITGWRENVIRLFVIGYKEVIGWPNSWVITFTCAPDQQFNIGTYAPSTTQKRYDAKTATLAASVPVNGTTLTLKATDDETWSNASTYDVLISGERVTFTAGQVGARTGVAGAYQQIVTNVVRSRNGVRKQLPAGAPIHVFEQGRWAL